MDVYFQFSAASFTHASRVRIHRYYVKGLGYTDIMSKGQDTQILCQRVRIHRYYVKGLGYTDIMSKT